MTERIVSGYRRLFEIRLLHHYRLDEGAKQKPSQGLVKAVKSGDKITRIVSEIFV